MGRPGWPAVLDRRAACVLRPYRRSDAAAWSECGIANEEWLAPWEPTPPGLVGRAELAGRVPLVHREHAPGRPPGRRDAVRGLPARAAAGNGSSASSPWATSCGGRSAPRTPATGSTARVAGRGRHPDRAGARRRPRLRAGGLHRIEVNIRPENRPSAGGWWRSSASARRRTTPRYLHIDGAWRDHIGYALTTEDVAAEGGLLARWHRLRACATLWSAPSNVRADRRGAPCRCPARNLGVTGPCGAAFMLREL